MPWLFKEEPSSYSFDALVADGRTVWSGVRNPVAQKHLRAVKKDDRVLYYHTGNEKAVVGTARALGDAYPDPDDRSGKAFVVDIAPETRLDQPVSLATLKAQPLFAGHVLARMPRLSVMPVSTAQWALVDKLARRPGGR